MVRTVWKLETGLGNSQVAAESLPYQGGLDHPTIGIVFVSYHRGPSYQFFPEYCLKPKSDLTLNPISFVHQGHPN